MSCKEILWKRKLCCRVTLGICILVLCDLLITKSSEDACCKMFAHWFWCFRLSVASSPSGFCLAVLLKPRYLLSKASSALHAFLKMTLKKPWWDLPHLLQWATWAPRRLITKVVQDLYRNKILQSEMNQTVCVSFLVPPVKTRRWWYLVSQCSAGSWEVKKSCLEL